MKYTLRVETELTLEFEPWEGCDADAYAEQVAHDSVSKPSYVDSGLTIDYVLANVAPEAKP